jgi:hypothetical protein
VQGRWQPACFTVLVKAAKEYSMIRTLKDRPLILVALLMAVMAQAQTQRHREALSVQGYPGEATVVQLQGRVFVDVQDLARITKGSLSFEKNRIILMLARGDGSELAGDAGQSGFSHAFMRAAIEAVASIREWGGTLRSTVQDGLPVGNTMAGNVISVCQGRASDRVALASVAASTDSDYRGLDLLRNEFNSVQAWSDRYVEARNSMSAANLTMSENAFKDDQEAQKMLRCSRFLAQMFASGTFQEDAACH